jgi:hypothetical protein
MAFSLRGRPDTSYPIKTVRATTPDSIFLHRAACAAFVAPCQRQRGAPPRAARQPGRGAPGRRRRALVRSAAGQLLLPPASGPATPRPFFRSGPNRPLRTLQGQVAQKRAPPHHSCRWAHTLLACGPCPPSPGACRTPTACLSTAPHRSQPGLLAPRPRGQSPPSNSAATCPRTACARNRPPLLVPIPAIRLGLRRRALAAH